MLWDNLEGFEDGEGDGREVPEGGGICVPVADSWGVWQKPAQYCKAIIFQKTIFKNIKARQMGVLP